MNNEILYILLPDYAAHEAVYLSQAISSGEFALKEKPKYINKIVAPLKKERLSVRYATGLPSWQNTDSSIP